MSHPDAMTVSHSMAIPYLVHVPFVAVFLLFTLVFVVTHWAVRRR